MIESSFGVIPARQVEGKWQLLMVKHHAGHWAFPKGHADPGETPLQTAKRELLEETGLEIVRQLYPHSFKEEYRFKKNNQTIEKSVTYFLAEVTGKLCLQKEELSNSMWVPLQDAEKQATFSEAQKLCQEIKQVML